MFFLQRAKWLKSKFSVPELVERVLTFLVLKIRRKQKVNYAQLGDTIRFLHVSRLLP